MRGYDVAVIGAGPAGSSAARAAALAGLETVLLEKERLPRDKPCGGVFSQKSRSYLDFDLPAETICAEVTGVRLAFDGCAAEFGDRIPFAWLVRRADFDHYLARKAVEAGAELRDASRVEALRQAGGRIELATSGGTISASAAIVAEGAQGRLMRCVRRRQPAGEMAACAVAWIDEPGGEAQAGCTIEIHLGAAPGGYAWVFRTARGTSVGIGGVAARTRNPRRALADFVARRGLDLGGVHPRVHLIPLGGVARPVARERVFLAGDAAACADALLGEGIGAAVRSGQLAGEAAAALARGAEPAEAGRRYRERMDRELGAELRGALVMAKILHGAPGVFLRSFAVDERLGGAFRNVGMGRWSHARYMAWMAARLPVSLAKVAAGAVRR